MGSEAASPPSLRSRKPVLGLVGGMGSGKSLVADLLAQRGGQIVSGDRLGHQALRDPEVRRALVTRWGPGVLQADGEVDRKRVGRIVFADPAERRALEAVSFPWIERGIAEETARAQANPEVAFVVLDAAIMMETGWDRHCDRLVFIDAPRDVRLRRLAEGRGWSVAEVEARERAQLPLETKRQRADAVIDNGGTTADTERQLDALLESWGISPSRSAANE